MILITGGLGFIGLHTAHALIEAGKDVVLTQYRVAREPSFITPYIGKRAFIEQLDVTDGDRLMEIGDKHEITKIVHLAVPALRALSPADDYRVNMFGLYNILDAAEKWKVQRLGLASSQGIYQGEPKGPFKEDMKLRMMGQSATEAYKKAFEVLGQHYALRTGLDITMLRVGGIFGPLYHSMANLPSRLAHAAVKGTDPKLDNDFEEDGGDACYVKDCGVGVAAVMTAESLPHNVYNISWGRQTKAKEILEAVKKAVPGFDARLNPGAGPQSRAGAYGDPTQMHADTGFEPRYNIDTAMEDYVAWLRENDT